MAQTPESGGDGFWDREALLAQRENALFSIEDQLRQREEILLEREAALGVLNQEYAARETVLIDRELTLRETEALLDARARVLSSAQAHGGAENLKALETAALKQIKEQFDEREAKLKAAELDLRGREAFVQKSENTICEKGQQLQEWEAELEQLSDELKARGKDA